MVIRAKYGQFAYSCPTSAHYTKFYYYYIVVPVSSLIIQRSKRIYLIGCGGRSRIWWLLGLVVRICSIRIRSILDNTRSEDATSSKPRLACSVIFRLHSSRASMTGYARAASFEAPLHCRLGYSSITLRLTRVFVNPSF